MAAGGGLPRQLPTIHKKTFYTNSGQGDVQRQPPQIKPNNINKSNTVEPNLKRKAPGKNGGQQLNNNINAMNASQNKFELSPIAKKVF